MKLILGISVALLMALGVGWGSRHAAGSKFTLGTEGSVAAGPVVRTATAQTDAQKGVRAPGAAARLIALLNRYSAKERTE